MIRSWSMKSKTNQNENTNFKPDESHIRLHTTCSVEINMLLDIFNNISNIIHAILSVCLCLLKVIRHPNEVRNNEKSFDYRAQLMRYIWKLHVCIWYRIKKNIGDCWMQIRRQSTCPVHHLILKMRMFSFFPAELWNTVTQKNNMFCSLRI